MRSGAVAIIEYRRTDEHHESPQFLRVRLEPQVAYTIPPKEEIGLLVIDTVDQRSKQLPYWSRPSILAPSKRRANSPRW